MFPPRAHRVSFLFLATVSLLVLSTCAYAASKVYEYTLFASGPDTRGPVDGANLTGVFCRPALSGMAIGNAVIFSDMCGAGSAIRSVASSGIHVLAGSLAKTGYVDGPPLQALFSGYPTGTTQVNGLAYFGGDIYMADSVNSVIRKVDLEGNVTTFVSPSARLNGLSLNFPLAVAPYSRKNNSNVLFISDTANNRIISTPLDGTVPLLTQLVSGFQPGALFVSQRNRVLFYICDSFNFGVTQLEGAQHSWQIGNSSCMQFVSSFVLFNSDTEILFFGGSGTQQGIYTIPANASETDAPSLCPTLKYKWNSSESISMLITRDDSSLYVITTTNVYLLSEVVVPWPPVDAIAAFPMSAFPVDDPCLMSQVYHWIRYDASIALKTTSYYSLFNDAKGNIVTYKGDVNVSSLCESITAQLSKDKSVANFNFLLPDVHDAMHAQSQLDNSPWQYTRLFLDQLTTSNVDSETSSSSSANLSEKSSEIKANSDEPNATSDSSASSTISSSNETDSSTPDVTVNDGQIAPLSSPSCDSLCKGAIATSATLGTIGAALIAIAIISPAALFSALIALPII